MRKISLSLLLFSGIATSSFAGGFQLNLQGIQQLAMGGSGTAYPWDASTVFYNPAGISRLSGIQAYGSILAVTPSIKYVQSPTGGYSYESVRQWFTPFNVYVGGPIKKNHKLGVGLAVYTPFGSGTKWEDDWPGRYLSREISLQSVFFQPTVSYQLNEMFSIGGGLIYAYGNVNLKQALPVMDINGNDGDVELEGNGNGFGFNLGLQVKATEELYLGLTYRSKVRMKVNNGDATFNVPSSLESAFPSGNFKAELPLPEVISLGAAYKITSDFTIQADLNYVGWKAYDTLSFDYSNNTPQLEDTKAPRLYEDKIAFRLGAHYQISDQFAAMIGGAYDPSPVRNGYVSPELPDANRYTGSLGLTYAPIPKVNIMIAAEFITSDKRDATYIPGNFSGKYQTKAFNGGLGISYKF